MALTFAFTINELNESHQGLPKSYAVAKGTVTMDDSYPTGGEAVAVTDFHATDCASIISMELSEVAAWSASFDETNKKILVYDKSDDAEADAAQDLTDVAFNFTAYLTRQ